MNQSHENETIQINMSIENQVVNFPFYSLEVVDLFLQVFMCRIRFHLVVDL